MVEETAPYIKVHDESTICFADTLVQAKNALERTDISEADKSKLDNAHLMLFGVEKWSKNDMGDLKKAMAHTNNNFERFEVFGCEMNESDQLEFGDMLDPENLENIKRFDLDNTPLKPKGALAIFSKLVEVHTIENLNLQGSIGGDSQVMAAIADSLVENGNIYKSLSKLDLKINDLKGDGAEHAASIISRMQALDAEGKCEADLFYNDIKAEGAGYIGKALQLDGIVITHLDLCCNDIGDEGAIAIADMLYTNRSLKSLKLALNNIGNRGGIAIMKTVAPKANAGTPKNTVLELLDLSANVMKEMKTVDKGDTDKESLRLFNIYSTQMEELLKEDEEAETSEAYLAIQKVSDALVFTYEQMPLVEAVSRVCTASHLLEFDFTGIELGQDLWDNLGTQLSTTHNKSMQKRGVPMKIRFSIVDLMNEDNLKIMEKYIWGKKENTTGPYHTYKHIDWRRRDDDETPATT